MMLFKRELKFSDFVFISVNLIPAFGVWFQGWDAKQMFLVYCLESIILGFFNVLKMLIVTFYKKTDTWENLDGTVAKASGLFFILFFMVHYGMFVFIQTTLFIGVSGLDKGIGGGAFKLFSHLPEVLSPEAQLMLLIFIGVYGLKMMTDFILTGEYKTTSLGVLMFQPYGRIFIQQIVVIFGSMFLAFGAVKIFMIIFIGIKLTFDLFVNFDMYIKAHAIDKMLAKKKGYVNDKTD
jgi:hypothetical protein